MTIPKEEGRCSAPDAMFDFTLVRDSIAQLVLAVPLTLGITAGALLLGMIVGIPVALARVSEARSLLWAANAYILFFRGTPALVQIFVVAHYVIR